MPKTKIVCTIGPASSSREVITDMIRSGMNAARLNFSHGTHEEHRQKIQMIREVSAELKQPVAILQDLCGPKIRVGRIPGDGIRLETGAEVILTSEPVIGTPERISVSYDNLPREVKVFDRILLADGMLELSVRATNETEIFCEVINGGILTSHKGVNLPSGSIGIASLTDKDETDLLFGLQQEVDYVALSFVRQAEDILRVKRIIASQGCDTPVIAKIEKHEAIQNIESIIEVSDGVMVARGDLGVEIPLEQVPIIQKSLVRKANRAGKPVIIATQMLRSMVNAPRPTRAETADVANAVLDGADAIMLSEETASGDYPVASVHYMYQIAGYTEKDFHHERYMQLQPGNSIPESVAYSSCVLANQLNAAAIVAPTKSGLTAVNISRFKPRTKVVALSPEPRIVRRLCLYWGCVPGLIEVTRDTDGMIENSALRALEMKQVRAGDVVVITAGHPVWVAGTTNMVKVKVMQATA